MKNKKIGIIISVLFVLLFFGLGYFFSDAKSSPDYRESQEYIDNLEVVDDPLLDIQSAELFVGNKDAKVTIIDFASMSCPHCASFYSDAYDKLKEEYIDTGLVRFAYRDFPLNQGSLVAAAIAICRASELDEEVRAQGYHNFVKKIYNSQNSWTLSSDPLAKLIDIAVLDGMEKRNAVSCSKDKELHDEILKMRMLFAKRLQIESTPTFFINKKRVQGFISYEEIKNVIDSELNK